MSEIGETFTCEFCGEEGPHVTTGHLCDYEDLLTIVSESKAEIARLRDLLESYKVLVDLYREDNSET